MVPREVTGSIVLQPRKIEALFHGFIGKERVEKNVDGYMNDLFGQSAITEFLLSETRLTFRKVYLDNASTPILYRLDYYNENKNGCAFFSGGWSVGIDEFVIAQGKAKCILTKIPDNFFEG